MGKVNAPRQIKRPKKKDQTAVEIESVIKKYDEFNSKSATTFDDFPLSQKTLSGLMESNFVEPTDIQRESIGLALRGCDVLGAAMTGSGKTLAFLIPILEMLWRDRWSRFDGVGALIISPTRELAMQTYEVLRKIGAEHDFSAALIVGGTDVSYEAKRLAGKNIIVCTPGRLLQHMDETPNFNCDTMKMLVIDEADRLLDMGFAGQLNAIISNLPTDRQTLLFSATQTRSVKDLARLSLKDPVYVSVHEHAKYSTPEHLRQSYVICEEHDKFTMLWSFVKNHHHSKVLAFMSNCKQVRFAYEAFLKLRPHTTVLCLHGSMPQMKRVSVYQQFCNKHHVVLLATDIAARGLDFPAVDWVLQLDCPSDANEYIHRCGRTARYNRGGESLLVLTPSQESAMITDLESKKIPISRITINPEKLTGVQKKLEAYCTQDSKLKISAQRAFVAYVRSVFLMSNKKVFDVKQIDCEALARSFGLAVTPRIRFLRKQNLNNGASVSAYSKPANPVNNLVDDDEDYITPKKDKSSNAVLEVAAKRSNDEFSGWGAEVQDDDLFMVKQRDVFKVSEKRDAEEDEEEEDQVDVNPVSEVLNVGSTLKGKPLTRAAVAKKILKKKIVANKKVTFDEEGNANQTANQRRPETGETAVKEGDDGYSIDAAKKMMEEEDQVDRRNFRKRVKEKHREEKRKRKLAEMEKRQNNNKAPGVAVLGSADDREDNESGSEVYDHFGGGSDQELEDFDEKEECPASEEESEEEDVRPKKKKRLSKRRDVSSDEEEPPQLQQDYSDLDLADAEKMALRLLDG